MTLRRLFLGLGTAAAAITLGFAGAAQAQSNDPSFRLNNRSNQTIMELYVSSSAVSNWGPDLLGANVLPAGQSFVVRLPAGQCVNDIRIVFADGRSTERRSVDTCNLSQLAFP